MSWTDLDWDALDRHRERFLSGKPCDGPYWSSAEDLAGYDATFGERIGWKWDAVLDELRMRGWAPRGGTVLDWGCGSGIAGRRVVGRFGPACFGSLVVWDHSPIAADFAQDAASTRFPGLAVSAATPGFRRGRDPIGLLVVSHVLNELPPPALDEIRALVARSRAVIWTEHGSRETSRALGSLRDEWKEDFQVVAPCTHGNLCPVLGPGNERHWCHHFAAPPPGIFADSNWVKFGQRARIDLRSLPYAFVALDRDWNPDAAGLSRVIGRPEPFKPYARLLNCDAGGLAELTVSKRNNAALYKELGKSKRPLVYRWTRDGPKITGGSTLQA
ncbi:MAG TPA: small ribosomal subunit Rsm22 family protein [Opitutaceae bacterium]|nr:small ribosomal subunit Rsm22 family protein [Opitutaceae bacterium]